MVTTKQILAETSIEDPKTLYRWHRLGVIPPPGKGLAASGRGRISLWPDWVLDRCKRIIELQKQGYSLKGAANFLDTVGAHATKLTDDDGRLIRIRRKPVYGALGGSGVYIQIEFSKSMQASTGSRFNVVYLDPDKAKALAEAILAEL
jgi:DNA-binding transcriptional MerR regulator